MNTSSLYPNQLLRHRRITGLSYKQAARILGIQNENIISRWERGLIMPTGINLFKMCVLYNAGLHELYPNYYKKIECLFALRREKIFGKRAPPFDRSKER